MSIEIQDMPLRAADPPAIPPVARPSGISFPSAGQTDSSAVSIFDTFNFHPAEAESVANLPLAAYLGYFPRGIPPARLYEERATHLRTFPKTEVFGYREFMKHYRLAQYIRTTFPTLSGREKILPLEIFVKEQIKTVEASGKPRTPMGGSAPHGSFTPGTLFFETESCEYRLADPKARIYEYNALRRGGVEGTFARGGVPDGFVTVDGEGRESGDRVSYALLDDEIGKNAAALGADATVPLHRRDFNYYRAALARLGDGMTLKGKGRGLTHDFFDDDEGERGGDDEGKEENISPTLSPTLLREKEKSPQTLSLRDEKAPLRAVAHVKRPGGARESVFEFPHGRAKITFLYNSAGDLLDARVFSTDFVYPAVVLARDWEREVNMRLSRAEKEEQYEIPESDFVQAKRAIIKSARDLITYRKALKLLPKGSAEYHSVENAITRLVSGATERYGAVFR